MIDRISKAFAFLIAWLATVIVVALFMTACATAAYVFVEMIGVCSLFLRDHEITGLPAVLIMVLFTFAPAIASAVTYSMWKEKRKRQC